MNMDAEFDRTIDRLVDASNSHPNLSKLWTNYILLKKTAYEKALLDANAAVDTLSATQDPDNESLVALFALSQVMSASNR